MFTSGHSKLRRAINDYDPYGFFRVTAAQGLFVMTSLCLINFIFAPPYFNTMLKLPALGFLAIAREYGFRQRILAMAVFCFISVSYACILTILEFYRLFFVLAIGLVIISLFILSRKIYPSLLFMIPVIQAITYALLIPPLRNSPLWIIHTFVTYGALILLTLGLMYLFPRIYFFRMFLRGVYLTLQEVHEKILSHLANSLDLTKLLLTHISPTQDYAITLSYKEHGISAQKMTLYLMHIYTFLVGTVHSIEKIEERDLQHLAHCCEALQKALAENRCMENISHTTSTNPAVQEVFSELRGMIRIWNQLCLKT